MSRKQIKVQRTLIPANGFVREDEPRAFERSRIAKRRKVERDASDSSEAMDGGARLSDGIPPLSLEPCYIVSN